MTPDDITSILKTCRWLFRRSGYVAFSLRRI
jgi:hypothetical protein